jgi:hypothetical protein
LLNDLLKVIGIIFILGIGALYIDFKLREENGE